MAYIDCENCYHGKVCAERHIYHDMIVSCPHHIPTADVVEVKHGEWMYKYTKNGWDTYECSCCSNEIHIDTYTGDKLKNYCDDCGAKMDERSKQ